MSVGACVKVVALGFGFEEFNLRPIRRIIFEFTKTKTGTISQLLSQPVEEPN